MWARRAQVGGYLVKSTKHNTFMKPFGLGEGDWLVIF